MLRFGSKRPKRLPMTITAGPRVSAAMTATKVPTAQGTPMVWKYGSRVKVRHSIAPAMVSPDPSTTWAVPRNIV